MPTILRVSTHAEPEGVTADGNLDEEHSIKLNASDIRRHVLACNPNHPREKPFEIKVTLTIQFDADGVPLVQMIDL